MAVIIGQCVVLCRPRAKHLGWGAAAPFCLVEPKGLRQRATRLTAAASGSLFWLSPLPSPPSPPRPAPPRAKSSSRARGETCDLSNGWMVWMPASRLLLGLLLLLPLPALQPQRDASDHARSFSRNRSIDGGGRVWSEGLRFVGYSTAGAAAATATSVLARTCVGGLAVLFLLPPAPRPAAAAAISADSAIDSMVQVRDPCLSFSIGVIWVARVSQ